MDFKHRICKTHIMHIRTHQLEYLHLYPLLDLKPDCRKSESSENMGTQILQGAPCACGKGYVDICSDSYQGYPETELMST